MSPQLSVLRRFLYWVKSPAVRVGIFTGVCLSLASLGSLLLATRVPKLEPYAPIRDLFSIGVFLLVMLMPIGRFLKTPRHLFLSGLIAWSFFSLTYLGMGGIFWNLFVRLRTPGLVFASGVICYGWLATAAWVLPMLARARHTAPTPSRRRAPNAHR